MSLYDSCARLPIFPPSSDLQTYGSASNCGSHNRPFFGCWPIERHGHGWAWWNVALCCKIQVMQTFLNQKCWESEFGVLNGWILFVLHPHFYNFSNAFFFPFFLSQILIGNRKSIKFPKAEGNFAFKIYFFFFCIRLTDFFLLAKFSTPTADTKSNANPKVYGKLNAWKNINGRLNTKLPS